MRYGYAASIGGIVWALTKGASDREGRLTGVGDGGHLTGSKRCGVMVRRQTIAIEQHFY